MWEDLTQIYLIRQRWSTSNIARPTQINLTWLLKGCCTRSDTHHWMKINFWMVLDSWSEPRGRTRVLCHSVWTKAVQSVYNIQRSTIQYTAPRSAQTEFVGHLYGGGGWAGSPLSTYGCTSMCGWWPDCPWGNVGFHNIRWWSASNTTPQCSLYL